jgi:hypothetical protein
MRPRNIAILSIIVIAASTWTIADYRKAQGRKLRETHYQSTLKSYSSELKLGMSREEVHDLLRNRSVIPTHEPYGGPPLDDFIKIGREQDEWYCSWENVNIQLHYEASKPNSIEPISADLLREITLSRWAYDCL